MAEAKESKLSTANKRRSSAMITKYKKGDKVRLISSTYLKSAGSAQNVRSRRVWQAAVGDKTESIVCRSTALCDTFTLKCHRAIDTDNVFY